jgi:hypothetical protein
MLLERCRARTPSPGTHIGRRGCGTRSCVHLPAASAPDGTRIAEKNRAPWSSSRSSSTTGMGNMSLKVSAFRAW